MAEMTGKRPRRPDSSSMWDENEPPPKRARESHGGRDSRENYRRRSASGDRNERRRDRSRSRDRDRDGYRDRRRDRDTDERSHRRDRSRSRDAHRSRRDSPRRHARSRSRSPRRDILRNNHSPRARVPEASRTEERTKTSRDNHGVVPMAVNVPVGVDAGEGDPDAAMMKRMMGFSGFRSTKNTKVPGNNTGAVRKDKQTKYRQYMNRVGGFNRPLSPSR